MGWHRLALWAAAAAALGITVCEGQASADQRVSVSVPSTAKGFVTISAQASAGPSFRSLRIYIDASVVKTCAITLCSYRWDTTKHANGQHLVFAQRLATNGSVANSSVVRVNVVNGSATVDTTPPSVTINAPASASGTVGVSVSATDAGGIASLQLLIDGSVVAASTKSPLGYSWDTTKASNATHTLQASAKDPTGNVGSSVLNVAVNNAPPPPPVDTTPPSVTINAPSSASGTVGVSVSATDAGGIASLQLLIDGGVVASSTKSPLSYSWDTTKVSNTTHTLQASAKDPSGNVGTSAVGVAVNNGSTNPGGGGTFLTGLGTYQVPNVPRPGLRQPTRDPVFGATVTRVTEPSMGSAVGYRHEYARLAALNANNTRAVLIQMSGWNYQVIELATGKVVGTVPGVPCVQDPSIAWHRTDPDLLIYFCNNEIRTFKVSTNVVTTLMKLTEYTSIDTREEGTVSDDWHYAVFFGHKSGGGTDVVTVDLVARTALARNSSIAFGDWVGMSPSGQYVVIQHDDAAHGTRVYDRSLNYLRTLHPDGTHEDFAIDADGQEVMVWYAWSDGQVSPFGGRSVVAKARLSDGVRTELIDTRWKWAGHVSGVGSRGRPGWILASTYDNPGAANDSPFQREIFWLKLDGSGAVQRLAHHHSDQGSCNADKDYWAEPHAVGSWDGSKVLFASVWGAPPCTRYDTYIIESW